MQKHAHRFSQARAEGRCYVIAEAGSNHNHDLSLARRLIDEAANANADAIKFQLFSAEKLYPSNAGTADYLGDTRDISDIVRTMELPVEWLGELAEQTVSLGLDFLATPFDERSADSLDQFVPVFKLASYELTHHPLLRHVAAKGKPLIMSTGASDLSEIADALDVVYAAGAHDVTLLQCTAAYPARLDALNLAALDQLRERFGIPVGLSDHSADPVVAPVVAVARGATVIEKHFTLDRRLPGPDHAFAIEPAELSRLVQTIRDAEATLGTGEKAVHPDEEELRSFARRSIFAVQTIEPGEILSASNVAVLRNGKRGTGLPPSELESVLGRTAARRLLANSPLQDDDLR